MFETVIWPILRRSLFVAFSALGSWLVAKGIFSESESGQLVAELIAIAALCALAAFNKLRELAQRRLAFLLPAQELNPAHADDAQALIRDNVRLQGVGGLLEIATATAETLPLPGKSKLALGIVRDILHELAARKE